MVRINDQILILFKYYYNSTNIQKNVVSKNQLMATPVHIQQNDKERMAITLLPRIHVLQKPEMGGTRTLTSKRGRIQKIFLVSRQAGCQTQTLNICHAQTSENSFHTQTPKISYQK